MFPVKEILEEVEGLLKERPLSIDHLSLSGSWNPLVHSQISLRVIEGLKALPLSQLCHHQRGLTL